MKDWNSIYEAKGVFQKKPSPRVLSAIRRFREEGLSRVLDLGCGTGRHTTQLLDAGFAVYGCDASAAALGVISELIPEADFQECDMTSLPYEADFFDGIICNHVIQHGKLAAAREAVGEIRRILRPGGRLHLIVVSTEHPKCATGREIEPGTRIDTAAVDGHVPHHFFSEGDLRELFGDFEILNLEHFVGPSELEPSRGSAAWELSARKA